MTSGGLWVALLWLAVIGSRTVSLWFGGGTQLVTPDDYIEGSPFDRAVFLLLIVAGLGVLLRRKPDWGTILTTNRWLFAFFLYCCVSVLWSDYPFVGFKRWVKDFGNVVMVLIVLTEKDPICALKAVFARYTYLAIPLSVVLVKYFPDLGRYYNRWTWEPAYCGVATEKNALGCIAFVCGLVLVWDWTAARVAGERRMDRTDVLGRVVLLLMVVWLIGMAVSSTARVCLLIGTGVLLFMRLPSAKRRVRYLGTYSLAAVILIVLPLYFAPGVREAFIGAVGRDMTLTGRTDLWADLLNIPINPLLGTGYQSFWLGPRADNLWHKYSFHPNQAHNGYLETYLNVGFVGLGLLLAVIVSTAGRLKQDLSRGDDYARLRFSFLLSALVYNWTEAMFNRLSLVWIILLVASLDYPPWRAVITKAAPSAPSDPIEIPPKRRSAATVASGVVP